MYNDKIKDLFEINETLIKELEQCRQKFDEKKEDLDRMLKEVETECEKRFDQIELLLKDELEKLNNEKDNLLKERDDNLKCISDLKKKLYDKGNNS